MAKLRSAPRGRVGELELVARRQLVLTYVTMIRTLNAQIKDLEGRDPRARCARTPTARSSSRCSSPVQRDHRRGASRRDRRLPRALSRPRRARRRRRPGRGRRRVREVEDRRVPQSVQQAPTRRVLPPGGLKPPLAPLGPDALPQARQRGHDHPRAIRTVGRAWCRVVWQCWRNHTTYDPSKHRALQRHITVTIPKPTGASSTTPPPSEWPDPVSGDRTSPPPDDTTTASDTKGG